VEHPTTIAVDLAKSVFEVAVSTEPGRVCQRRRLTRGQMASFFANRPPATVLMEACGTAHFWGRQIASFGHRVLLLPAQHVCRYRLRDKTDAADALALLEAHRNEKIVPVPVKDPAQQAISSLHRIRSGWIATRTARLNAVRGLLRELGINIPLGAKLVLPRLSEALSQSEGSIPETLHPVLLAAAAEIRSHEQNIKDVDRQLEMLSRSARGCQPALGARHRPSDLYRADRLGGRSITISQRETLGQLSGPGPARALLGVLPTPGRHHQARRFVPANPFLTHGARAVLWAAKHDQNPDALRRWALTLQKRRGHNRATIALANKLARIAWAVWSKNTVYQPRTTEAIS